MSLKMTEICIDKLVLLEAIQTKTVLDTLTKAELTNGFLPAQE